MSWTRWQLVVHDWMGQYWAELLRITLLCTALDWTRLDSTAVDLYGPGLRWIKMHLAEGNELELDWTARQWSGTEPDSTSED